MNPDSPNNTIGRWRGLPLALAATAAVLALAYGPMLWEFGGFLWQRPHYQHYPFVVAAFGWLFWTGYQTARPRADAHPARWPSALLNVAGWLTLVAAHLCTSPWLAAVSLTLVIGAAFVRVAGGWRFPYLLGVWLLLWLVIPPPMGRDVWFIALLQRASSAISSRLLDLLGVLHLMEGNTLTLGGKRLFVDEACSGIVSVMSILAAAAIYGVWRRRPPAQVLMLMALGIGWAVLLNAVRITLIAYLLERFGIDWSEGTPHTWLGLALFSVTFGLLVSSEHAVRWALEPVADAWRDVTAAKSGYGSGLASLWDAVVKWGASEEAAVGAGADRGSLAQRLPYLSLGIVPLVAFGGLGAGQFAANELLEYEDVAPVEEVLARAHAFDPKTLPAEVAGARRADTWEEEREVDDIFGAFSHIARYRTDAGDEFLVSVDFPFATDVAHDLEVCYSGSGWRREHRRNMTPRAETGVDDSASDEPWRYTELLLDRENGEKAAVLFCGFDEAGRSTWLSGATLVETVLQTLERRRVSAVRRSYQVQVWLPKRADGKQSAEQVRVATELLLACRERLRSAVVEGTAPPAVATAPEAKPEIKREAAP
ncbi:MAG: exosortase U [Lacipirellulaceae bacterium]